MNLVRHTWAEIYLDAIEHNIRVIRASLQSSVRFCAVLKADAYGHGAFEVARAALRAGADMFSVAIIQEALDLRKNGLVHPILVMGYTPPDFSRLLIENNITQTVFSKEQVEALSASAVALGIQAKVHLKIDSGMSRIGVSPYEALNFASYVASMPGLSIEGAFTHFSNADEENKALTFQQFSLFQQAVQLIKEQGIQIPLVHCANSAATLDMPEAHCDMVRVGISLYGLWPSAEVKRNIPLVPAMHFKTRIAQCKTIEPESIVSYGATFKASSARRIATLPVGYADGWPRLLSNKGTVLVHGLDAPIVGRICMDQCMIDVTDIFAAEANDEVVLFGPPEAPIEMIASHCGTINYEIVARIGKRVPRVYCAAPICSDSF